MKKDIKADSKVLNSGLYEMKLLCEWLLEKQIDFSRQNLVDYIESRVITLTERNN